MRISTIDLNDFLQYLKISNLAAALPTAQARTRSGPLPPLEVLLGILKLRGDPVDVVRSQKGAMLVAMLKFWQRHRGRWRSSCGVTITQQVPSECPSRSTQIQTAGRGRV
jgi:hypothetical protein